MNDDRELAEVRESLNVEGADLAGVHMDRPAEAVMARGQTLRLRRRLLRGLSGVTAAGAALALALAVGGAASGVPQVHVNEADWSVNTNQNGTVILEVKRIADPVRLQSVLAEAGVPATVHWGVCVVSKLALLPLHLVKPYYRPLSLRNLVHHPSSVWEIHPALVPPHVKLLIGSWTTKAPITPLGARMTWAIVPGNVRVHCPKRPFPAPIVNLYPSCTASPSATPSPLGTPTPGATPSPLETPSPGATPSPLRTPSPHATPSPLRTPSPGATPSPLRTPSPHATPSPHPSCTTSPHPTSSPHETPSPPDPHQAPRRGLT